MFEQHEHDLSTSIKPTPLLPNRPPAPPLLISLSDGRGTGLLILMKGTFYVSNFFVLAFILQK